MLPPAMREAFRPGAEAPLRAKGCAGAGSRHWGRRCPALASRRDMFASKVPARSEVGAAVYSLYFEVGNFYLAVYEYVQSIRSTKKPASK
jgi:hypothetical protein